MIVILCLKEIEVCPEIQTATIDIGQTAVVTTICLRYQNQMS